MSMSDASMITRAPTHEASFGDYFALLKPRVMSLVVFTAMVGLFAAPISVHPMVAFSSILFIAIGGGASGALNMWWDADIDAIMRRTRSRPIPSGKVTPEDAKAIGIALSGFSVVMLALASNLFAAGLLVHNFLLRGDLHSVAQALDTSEHCDRWRGRGLPADDWLGRCNGWDQLRKRADVRFDFCLDSTAFLGFGAVYAQ
jgi:heme O synthase-like polyprenyltransferase